MTIIPCLLLATSFTEWYRWPGLLIKDPCGRSLATKQKKEEEDGGGGGSVLPALKVPLIDWNLSGWSYLLRCYMLLPSVFISLWLIYAFSSQCASWYHPQQISQHLLTQLKFQDPWPATVINQRLLPMYKNKPSVHATWTRYRNM